MPHTSRFSTGVVQSARISKSRPGMGVVEIEWALSNQREQVVSMKATGLYAVRAVAQGGAP